MDRIFISESNEAVIRIGSERPRILFVSIYPKLSAIARKIALELNLSMDILEGGIHKNGHLYAKEHQENYDVIISQAGTANAIQGNVYKPVIAIALTVRDYLQAFEEARELGKKFVLISHKGDSQKDLEALFRAMFNDTAQSYTYSCREDFNIIVKKVMALSKDHAVIGFGGCVAAHAKQYGLPYVVIRSAEQHIKEALLSAKNIVDLHAKNKVRSRRLNSILNYSREGILAVDNEAHITICNISAKRMLGLQGQHLVSMSLISPQTPSVLRRLYGDGSFALNELIILDDQKYLVSRVPIQFRSEQRETVITFQRLVYIQKVEAKARAQLGEKGLYAKYSFKDIVANSEAMNDVLNKAKKFSKTHASVLIEGETGTGKELFAQSIHNASPRKQGPFVAINCAALPENLLESELFGYEEGAFTGAKKGGKLGLFELAHNGTIFLDEIGETSMNIQGRLLRVLQEKEIMRIGGDKVINVNSRIIAATNKNIYQMATLGQFRNDLYFRLSLLTLYVPPLNMRKEDIPWLTEHFMRQYASKYNREITPISNNIIKALQEYSWPGNVRELENCIGRSVILREHNQDMGRVILDSLYELGHQRQDINSQDYTEDNITLEMGCMKNMQQQIIEKMLLRYEGNKSKVADKLGVSRVTVWKKNK